MKEISEKAHSFIKNRIAEIQKQIDDTQKDIGFHGNDQDGWHGEAYQLSMIEFFTLTSRLEELKKQLREFQIVEYTQSLKVDIGSIIKLKIDEGPTREYVFDGTSYAKYVVTPESPIGNAIYHRKMGERVTYQTPAGEKQVEIVGIS